MRNTLAPQTEIAAGEQSVALYAIARRQHFYEHASPTHTGQEGTIRQLKLRQVDVRHPGIQLAILDLGTLVAGFCLFVGGLFMMIWAER